MALKRKRFDGEPSQLAEILGRHMPLPNFLGYGEDMGCPKQPAKILRVRQMWREVRQLHAGLTFTQDCAKTAFREAALSCGETRWSRPLTKAELKEWEVSIAKQFRVMARHICQSPKTAWVRRLWFEQFDSQESLTAEDSPLPKKQKKELAKDGAEEEDGGDSEGWHEEGEEEPAEVDEEQDDAMEPMQRSQPSQQPSQHPAEVDEVDGGDASQHSQPFVWFPGWDYEFGKAFRARSDTREKDWAVSIDRSGEHPIATFKDGMKLKVPNITSQQVAETENRQISRPGLAYFQHRMPSGETIQVRKGKDSRSQLVKILKKVPGIEQPKQLCQASIDKFGADTPEDIVVSQIPFQN